MRRAWEAYADDDPMFFIATEDRRWKRSWTAEEFYALGAEEVAQTLRWIEGHTRRERLLEIGCGLGRHTIHLAEYFHHVDAVDISPRMIEQAERMGMPDNIRLSVCSGVDLAEFADGTYDFVYSCLVFQHIPREDVIGSYLRETARVLRDDGHALLQFDSRPDGRAAPLREFAPNWLLPRSHRRFVRRHRRSPERLHELVAAAGLAPEEERGAGSESHQMLLVLAAKPNAEPQRASARTRAGVGTNDRQGVSDTDL